MATNIAYREGYKAARALLESGGAKKLHKRVTVMAQVANASKSEKKYFEGLASAEFDYENGNDWQF